LIELAAKRHHKQAGKSHKKGVPGGAFGNSGKSSKASRQYRRMALGYNRKKLAPDEVSAVKKLFNNKKQVAVKGHGGKIKLFVVAEEMKKPLVSMPKPVIRFLIDSLEKKMGSLRAEPFWRKLWLARIALVKESNRRYKEQKKK